MAAEQRPGLPASDLCKALKELNAVGLAANQVDDPRAFCVVAFPEHEPFLMVNPVIVEKSKEEGFEDEGCLSLPGVTVAVSRSLEVTVEYVNAEGIPLRERFTGLAARICQHEIDHLRGALILDYLSPIKRAKLKAYIGKAVRMERANVKAIAQGVGRLSAHAVDMQAAMSRRQIEKLMAKP